MSLAATPIHPMDSVPFSVTQEQRFRRLCDDYVTAALKVLKDVAERVVLYQILGQIPDHSLREMTQQELAEAVKCQEEKLFDFRFLDPQLHEAWQGYGLTIDALVPGEERRKLVSDWVEIALIVADRRAKRPN